MLPFLTGRSAPPARELQGEEAPSAEEALPALGDGEGAAQPAPRPRAAGHAFRVAFAVLACGAALLALKAVTSSRARPPHRLDKEPEIVGMDGEGCQDAIPWREGGGSCHTDTYWSMLHGIWLHPEWYHGLNAGSSFGDFQAANHNDGHGCPAPCKTGDPCNKRRLGDGGERARPGRSLDASSCPKCAPAKVGKVDIVIPFYDRDLCKLKYTAKAISQHDPDGVFGEVYMMWVSAFDIKDFMDKGINEAKESIEETHTVHLKDFTEQYRKSLMGGWFVQQVLKLKIASMVGADFYLVLDTKNTLITDVTPHTFFTPCNQARILGTGLHQYEEIPEPHKTWYAAAGRLLQVCPPGGHNWPTSVTPMVMHKATVLGLLGHIGENPSPYPKLCGGPLCYILGFHWQEGKDKFASEFALYIMYAYTQTQLECAHSDEKPDAGAEDGATVFEKWAVTLWKAYDGKKDAGQKNIETLSDISSGKLKALMVGAQPGAFKSLEGKDYLKAMKKLAEVYADAELYNASHPSELLAACVVGW